MDVWIAVEHEELAMPQVADLVDRFGLTERSRISVRQKTRHGAALIGLCDRL